MVCGNGRDICIFLSAIRSYAPALRAGGSPPRRCVLASPTRDSSTHPNLSARESSTAPRDFGNDEVRLFFAYLDPLNTIFRDFHFFLLASTRHGSGDH